VGIATPVIGEIGAAAVVARDPGDPPTLEQLRVWVRARLSDYKAPDRLDILDELPLTPCSRSTDARCENACFSRRPARAADDIAPI